MLLEALIAVLVTSVIAAGMAHVQARLMKGQRATKVERLAVHQLRDRLQTSGTQLCTATTTSLQLASGLSRDASISCAAAQQLAIGVAGVNATITAPRRVDLGITAADLEVGGDSAGSGAVDLLLSSRQ